MQMDSETWHLFTSELSSSGKQTSQAGERRRQTVVPEKLVLLFLHTDPANRKAVLPGAAVLLLNVTPRCPTLLAVPPEESENK